MLKIIISGCNGHMGRVVESLCTADPQVEIAAGFDILGSTDRDYPVFASPSQFTGNADAVIDFSSPAALDSLLEFAKTTKTPLVLATTGYSPEQIAKIGAAALEVPIFRSANMSLGIALLVELAKLTAKTFPDADIEIIEKHHNRKLDAPSGTALLLANAIREIRTKANLIFGRQGQAKRTPNEIGVHAIRMGNIIGEHEVIVGTDTQTVTLKHEAHSRALFAEGAIAAAEFLIGKPAGMYDMKSMIEAD